MNKHTSSDAGASIAERLASIPISAWEDEMPLLDACIRETLRMNVLGAALRRNVQDDDLHIGGRVIEKGTFITYSMADVHLNNNIYPNPEKFDPERFTVRGEDVASPMTYAYVGWGAGKLSNQVIFVCGFSLIILLQVDTLVLG
jgi:sterol 14-demethylase